MSGSRGGGRRTGAPAEAKKRLEVWRLRGGQLVLVVQSDLLLHMSTRVVVPLSRPGAYGMVEDINPVFEVGGERLAMESQSIAGVRASELAERVGSLAHEANAIQRALDRLLTTALL